MLATAEANRKKHLAFDSYLENMFIEKTKDLGIPFKREVYFNIENVSYYLDFFCEEDNVAVEIDGIQHHDPKAQSWDINRDKVFAFIGIKTIRFKREDLMRKDFHLLFVRKYGKAKLEAPKLRNPQKRKSIVKSYNKKQRKATEKLTEVHEGIVLITPKGTRQLFLRDFDPKEFNFDGDRGLWCIGKGAYFYHWGLQLPRYYFEGFDSKDSPLKVKVSIEMLETSRVQNYAKKSPTETKKPKEKSPTKEVDNLGTKVWTHDGIVDARKWLEDGNGTWEQRVQVEKLIREIEWEDLPDDIFVK